MENQYHGHQQAHEHHIVPLRVYLLTFFALIVLTAITVWIATVDLGALNIPLAFVVATIKASLVAFFFMHIKYTRDRLIPLFLLASLIWLVLLLVGTMMDPLTRSTVQFEGPMQDDHPAHVQDPAERATENTH